MSLRCLWVGAFDIFQEGLPRRLGRRYQRDTTPNTLTSGQRRPKSSRNTLSLKGRGLEERSTYTLMKEVWKQILGIISPHSSLGTKSAVRWRSPNGRGCCKMTVVDDFAPNDTNTDMLQLLFKRVLCQGMPKAGKSL